MLSFLLIVLAFGGMAGLMGYTSSLESKKLKSRMAGRNRWLQKHALSKDATIQNTNASATATDDSPT